MMRLSLRRLLPLTLLAAAVACSSDEPIGPAAVDDAPDPIELSLEALDRGEVPPGAEDHRVPTLQRLLHEAISRVRAEQGDAAARSLLEPVRTLLREAREAREAGDRAAARRKLQEANLAAARIVVHVFGPRVAERLNAAVATGLSALRARIAEIEAAGGDVTRLTRAASSVQSLHDAAARLIATGAYPRAVLLSSHALDILRATARHDTRP
jgi:hypothetical protein